MKNKFLNTFKKMNRDYMEYLDDTISRMRTRIYGLPEYRNFVTEIKTYDFKDSTYFLEFWCTTNPLIGYLVIKKRKEK